MIFLSCEMNNDIWELQIPDNIYIKIYLGQTVKVKFNPVWEHQIELIYPLHETFSETRN